MPKEYKQNTPHSKIVEEDNFEYDPEKPKVNGKIRFYDPQTNKVYTDAERRYTFSKGKDFSMIKLSGCTLDEKFCDKVMKGVKKNAAR